MKFAEMAKKKMTKNSKSFEESLWETATKLRGSVESSEYKHVVLSLIFLKFVSDALVNLRDTLLSKLISGELRIENAEKLVEEGIG